MMTTKTDDLDGMNMELGQGFVLFSPSVRQIELEVVAEISGMFAGLTKKSGNGIYVQNVN